ncbi:endonuclease/exonuclease/phosphatase family protein [Pseudoroseicyclus sp. H15]
MAQPSTRQRRRARPWVAVPLIFVAALAVLIGLFAQLVPDATPLIGRLSRIVDSLRLHLLLLTLILAAFAWLLRWRRAGGAVAVAALVGLAILGGDYARRVAPVGAQTDLTVLWFNVLGGNHIAPETLAAAVMESGADIVAFAEAAPARDLPEILSETYPYSLGCTPDMRGACGLLILSRLPLEDADLADISPYSRKRRAAFTVTLPDRSQIAVMPVHMIKPWFFRYTADEEAAVSDLLSDWPGDLPLVVMGDFNAAPWSRRMLGFERRNGLLHARLPVASWPVPAGRAGIPIDHIMVSEGLAFTSLEEWGAGLGSNHIGLLAQIDVLGE